MSLALSQEQARRDSRWLDLALDEIVDELLLGHKNVTPNDKVKLKGILKHYAKKPHPFTSCVRDNTKRFGKGGAERVCATLKDVIRGTTKWRGKDKKGDKGSKGIKGLGQIDWEVMRLIDSIPDVEFEAAYGKVLGLAYDDVGAAPASAAAPQTSMLPEAQHRPAEPGEPSCAVCTHFDGTGFCGLYQAPTTADMTSAGFEQSQAASEEAELSQVFASASHVAAQLFLEDGAEELETDEKGVWKTVLRTGTWKLRPGPGQKPIKKPLRVVLGGPVKAGEVSLSMLMDAFEDKAVEHVTIPLTHDDKVDENTGYVRRLRIVPDDEEGHKLQALLDFTEPDVRDKVERGSIANTSVGVLFDFKRKSDAKEYPMVLKHTALTNSPWIDGMEPFGELAASQTFGGNSFTGTSTNGIRVGKTLVLSATHVPAGGGELMTTEPKNQDDSTPAPPPPEPSPPPAPPAPPEPSLTESLGLSAEEIRDRLDRAEELEKRLHARDVDDRVKGWQAEGVPPAILNAAKPIMLADDGGTALLLSEEETELKLTASQIVERLVAHVPRLNLSDAVRERDATDGRPADDTSTEVPHSQKVEETLAFIEGREPAAATTD